MIGKGNISRITLQDKLVLFGKKKPNIVSKKISNIISTKFDTKNASKRIINHFKGPDEDLYKYSRIKNNNKYKYFNETEKYGYNNSNKFFDYSNNIFDYSNNNMNFELNTLPNKTSPKKFKMIHSHTETNFFKKQKKENEETYVSDWKNNNNIYNNSDEFNIFNYNNTFFYNNKHNNYINPIENNYNFNAYNPTYRIMKGINIYNRLYDEKLKKSNLINNKSFCLGQTYLKNSYEEKSIDYDCYSARLSLSQIFNDFKFAKEPVLNSENDIYLINYKLITGYESFYYCSIGNYRKLFMEIERNPQNLWSKDFLGRNLLFIGAIRGYIDICEYLINKGISVNEIHKTGCTALHAAAYCGHFKVVQLLLDYGAKTDLRNNFGYLPIDKAVVKEIKELLKKSENDSILKLHQYLVSKKLATKLIQIYSNGTIIARKIICKLNNLPKKYKSLNIINEWIPAWHGTKFQYLKSIVELGLKPPGEKSKSGEKIKVNESHIKRAVIVNNINDWAEGIFVSPSVFYSAYPAYSEEIHCNNMIWRVLVEVRVKPYYYTEYGSTCPKYVPKFGEPKMLEYRINAQNQKEVQIVSLTFARRKIFRNFKNYKDGYILLLNN